MKEVVPLDSLEREFKNRSKHMLENILLTYEEHFKVNNNLTVQQNLVLLNSFTNTLDNTSLQDWYIEALGSDIELNSVSVIDKTFNHILFNLESYKSFGFNKDRLEHLIYILSNVETLKAVDSDSMQLLMRQLDKTVEDRAITVYRLFRLLIIAYFFNLYSTVLSVSNYIQTQIQIYHIQSKTWGNKND